MRLSNLTKPVALALALVLAAPAVGCAVPTGDAGDATEKVGDTSQALDVGPGQVLSGIQGAMHIYSMITTYQKYGEVSISNGEILDKVNEVSADVKILNDKVDSLQNSMNEVNANISQVQAVEKMGNIDQLMNGWVAANANEATRPGSLKTFYANVRAGIPDGYGVTSLADLDALATYASTAIEYRGQFFGDQPMGTPFDQANSLGVYAASVRLRIAEGFYILTLAKQDEGALEFFPNGAAVVAQDKRLAQFDEAFLTANNAMNLQIVAKPRTLRGQLVGGCLADTDSVFFLDSANLAFPYKKAITTSVVVAGGWYGTSNDSKQLLAECGVAQSEYVAKQTAIYGAEQMAKLLTSETAFAALSSAPDTAAPTIRVTNATFGKNGATDFDVTPFLRVACDMRGTCEYKVESATLGNISPSVAKAFAVSYTCGSVAKTASIAAEASGKSVTLSCR